MLEIAATNIMATQPQERRPTGTLAACAKKMDHINSLIWPGRWLYESVLPSSNDNMGETFLQLRWPSIPSQQYLASALFQLLFGV